MIHKSRFAVTTTGVIDEHWPDGVCTHRPQRASLWRPVARVASVSDEPTNAASEYVRNAFAFVTEHGSPTEELLRAGLTDDFTFEDRRSGLSFPDADADSWPKMIETLWRTGADGQPRFEAETLAVRGERFAAVAAQTDYGNGMLTESIHVVALDATLSVLQRQIYFDRGDIDGAMAELDRLHSQVDAT
jgi:hypothetical protein